MNVEQQTDFGVVVSGRNEGDRLRRCIRSLPSSATVVYVDSGSTDGSESWGSRWGRASCNSRRSKAFHCGPRPQCRFQTPAGNQSKRFFHSVYRWRLRAATKSGSTKFSIFMKGNGLALVNWCRRASRSAKLTSIVHLAEYCGLYCGVNVILLLD